MKKLIIVTAIFLFNISANAYNANYIKLNAAQLKQFFFESKYSQILEDETLAIDCIDNNLCISVISNRDNKVLFSHLIKGYFDKYFNKYIVTIYYGFPDGSMLNSIVIEYKPN